MIVTNARGVQQYVTDVQHLGWVLSHWVHEGEAIRLNIRECQDLKSRHGWRHFEAELAESLMGSARVYWKIEMPLTDDTIRIERGPGDKFPRIGEPQFE